MILMTLSLQKGLAVVVEKGQPAVVEEKGRPVVVVAEGGPALYYI